MAEFDLKAFFEEEGRRRRELLIKKHEQLNALAVKGEIVFAGSSLMEDFPIAELAQTLPERPVVYNRGIGGDTLEGFAARLDSAVIDLQPRRLFINIGTNDMGLEQYTLDALIANYRAILAETLARVPGVEIFVLSYYPMNRTAFPDPGWLGARTNAEIARANLRLSDLAGEMGVTYLDVSSCLMDAAGELDACLSVDGVHMFPKGYERVFDVLHKWIK